MLTATYSLVALSAEQKNACGMLSRLHHQIQNILQDLHGINRTCVETALRKLEQFEEYCHHRKMETYVIPAIRRTTHKADPVLAELESLRSRSLRILHSLQEQLRGAFDRGLTDVKEICSGMELYCSNLRKRFAKEEEELFPIVRDSLSIEEWFDLAAKFLSDDQRSRGYSAEIYRGPYPLTASQAPLH